jgi:diadenosine tetraphosphate (Ap4A) HIT family hydrolase
MNATITKFGYPATCVAETQHWCILARPQQVTLGALILVAKSDVQSFRALPPEAYADMQSATARIENGLQHFRPYDKINYLMLMMVDPHVHMHVIPRYAHEQMFADVTFKDVAWPAAPDLKTAPALSALQFAEIVKGLQRAFGALS